MAIYGRVFVGCVWLVVFAFAEIKIVDFNETPIEKKRGECVTFTAKNNYKPVTGDKTIQWFRYARNLNTDTRNLTVKKLTPQDSALYFSEMKTDEGKVKEVTRYWLTVKDCDIHEERTELSSSCKTACKGVCKPGWHFFELGFKKKKCFKYFPLRMSWENAYTYCQANGAYLATIDNQEENAFVGSLLQSGDGGWIGLNDKSQESIYIWNYQKQPRPSFFAWDKTNSLDQEPNNNNRDCNIENCIELKKTKKWNDAVCNAQFGYICQRYSKTDIPGWTCNGEKCFLYNRYQLAWNRARSSCMALNATLATISNKAENDFIGSLIVDSAWIGLNDRAEAGVYVWNDIKVDEFQNKAVYFNWDTGEPNDKLYNKLLPRCTGEDCVQIKKWNGSETWSDLNCLTTLPFICEKREDLYISFAAWIAISMGAGLVISILAARGYMEYKSKRARKDIKTALISERSNVKT